jgi:hypothetical protein
VWRALIFYGSLLFTVIIAVLIYPSTVTAGASVTRITGHAGVQLNGKILILILFLVQNRLITKLPYRISPLLYL